MSLTYSTRFTIANYEDQHLSTKKKFKPIYSKKYKLREKTNLEPLIPMGDQEIISPYYINTICSKVYSRPFFLLSNWHVSDCDRNAEVNFGGEKINNNEKKKKKQLEKKKKKDVSALHLTPRVLRLIFFRLV